MPSLAAQLEQRLVGAVEEAVGVLHAGDAGGQRLAELVEGHGADPDPADLALVAQRDHLGELVVEVDLLGPARARRASPSRRRLTTSICSTSRAAEVGLDAGAQLLGPLGGQPAAARRRASAPTLLTSTRSSGYGWRAAWISSLATPWP